ncbi:MAG: hypothetical protein JO056_04100 [Alphaproteobacteria bacterium]|nr:hypothetical protein [Alphaproteobacteria bacterium]
MFSESQSQRTGSAITSAIRVLTIMMAALVAAALAPHPAQAWKLKTLYSFCAKTHCSDGQFPAGPLVRDAAGNLFGVTGYGGYAAAYEPGGVVFELSPVKKNKWKLSTLYRFCADPPLCSDGYQPMGVIVDTAGNLYGTTGLNGPNGGGTAFELSPQAKGWALNTLYAFPYSGEPAAEPSGTLTYAGAAAGALYDGTSPLFGLTFNGGTSNLGAAYELSQTGGHWKLTEIHGFGGGPEDGAWPTSSLTMDPAGNLLGTTGLGGKAGQGTAFTLSPTESGWNETLLASMGTAPKTPRDPFGPLWRDASGTLFGTNNYGGQHCHRKGARCGGNVFRLSLEGDTWQYASVHEFCADETCLDGARPAAGVIMDASGMLIGTTQDGGAHQAGVIFRVRPDGTNYKVIHDFCGAANCADGKYPDALTLVPDGHIYGVTIQGGAHNGGTIFELSP